MRRLAQVRRPGLRGEVRPERLDHLVALQAPVRGEREQLHELDRAAPRPGVPAHLAVADNHAEAAEQLDADTLVRVRG
jgi:hypothetical protein